MTRRCLSLVVTAVAVSGGLLGAEAPPASAPHLTRVLYLQGMQPREASMLLRTELQIVQLATVPGRDVIVVSDVAAKIDRAGALLREKGALARAADPHGPLDLTGLAGGPGATRVLSVAGAEMNTAVTLLRAIYQVRELEQNAESGSITVHAAAPILDASEALLRELNLLAPPAAARNGS